MIMDIVWRRIYFPSDSEIESETVRYAPGVLDKGRQLPHPHAEGTVENVPCCAVQCTQSKVGQRRLGACATDLPGKLPIEVEGAASRKCRETIEPVTQKQK